MTNGITGPMHWPRALQILLCSVAVSGFLFSCEKKTEPMAEIIPPTNRLAELVKQVPGGYDAIVAWDLQESSKNPAFFQFKQAITKTREESEFQGDLRLLDEALATIGIDLFGDSDGLAIAFFSTSDSTVEMFMTAMGSYRLLDGNQLNENPSASWKTIKKTEISYRFRSEKIIEITSDQSFIQELYNSEPELIPLEKFVHVPVRNQGLIWVKNFPDKQRTIVTDKNKGTTISFEPDGFEYFYGSFWFSDMINMDGRLMLNDKQQPLLASIMINGVLKFLEIKSSIVHEENISSYLDISSSDQSLVFTLRLPARSLEKITSGNQQQ